MTAMTPDISELMKRGGNPFWSERMDTAIRRIGIEAARVRIVGPVAVSQVVRNGIIGSVEEFVEALSDVQLAATVEAATLLAGQKPDPTTYKELVQTTLRAPRHKLADAVDAFTQRARQALGTKD